MIDFTTITNLYLANNEVEELYINGSKVWEKGGSTPMPLTFTAEEANSTLKMKKNGSAPSVSLEYSTDGTTWSDFIVGTTTVTLANVGDSVLIRAKTMNSGMATNASDYNQFIMTGKIAASGSIMYLLKNDGDLDTISSNQCFRLLFYGCSSLTKAPELPATTLASSCYNNMFARCSSLTQAPELPANTLAGSCYRFMFANCSSLNSIKIAYTGNFSGDDVPTNAFGSWVLGVPGSGTFYYNGSDTSRGTDAIPNNWTIQTF